MALSAAVATGLTPAGSPNTSDITVAGFGTPDAAIIFIVPTDESNASIDDASISVGFWDGTNNVAVAVATVHDSSPTEADRYQNDGLVGIIPASNTYVATGITNGIQLEQTAGTAQSRHVTAILLKGVSNAAAGAYNLGTSTANQTINLGWRANCVLAVSVGLGGGDGTSNHSILSFGAATIADDDTVTQRTVAAYAQDGTNPTAAGSAARNDAIGGQYYTDTWAWYVAVEASNSGFIFDTDVSTNSDYIYYLALQLPSADDCYLIGHTSPTTGTVPFTESTTDVGFQPQALLAYGTKVDGFVNGDPDFGLFFGAADGTRSRTLGAFVDDDSNPVDAISHKTDKLVAVPSLAGSLAAATLDSRDSDGYTLEWDTIDTTGWRFSVLSFGDSTGGAAAASLVPRSPISNFHHLLVR